MNQTASSVVTDGIALITLDNPPVNALSAPLRQALQSELDRAFRDDQVHAIMLICAGRTFIEGAEAAGLRRFVRATKAIFYKELRRSVQAVDRFNHMFWDAQPL